MTTTTTTTTLVVEEDANNNNNNNNSGTSAILTRLKELETANTQLKHESDAKEDRIKELSADKRKDMERIVDTAVDKWLGSLKKVSEETRKQFRGGISKLAERADMKSAAWEIVCNASEAHETNVNRIEELLKTVNEQTETIKSMAKDYPPKSFTASEGLRVEGASSSSSHKRPREEEASSSSSDDTTTKRTKDVWDQFSSMLRSDAKDTYF